MYFILVKRPFYSGDLRVHLHFPPDDDATSYQYLYIRSTYYIGDFFRVNLMRATMETARVPFAKQVCSNCCLYGV